MPRATAFYQPSGSQVTWKPTTDHSLQIPPKRRMAPPCSTQDRTTASPDPISVHFSMLPRGTLIQHDRLQANRPTASAAVQNQRDGTGFVLLAGSRKGNWLEMASTSPRPGIRLQPTWPFNQIATETSWWRFRGPA